MRPKYKAEDELKGLNTYDGNATKMHNLDYQW